MDQAALIVYIPAEQRTHRRENVMPVMVKMQSRAEADFNVCVMESRGDADLFVCEIENRAQAREPGYWFYTDSRAEAEHAIFIIDSRAESNLNICYVESRREAGWRVKDHPLKGVL